MGDPLDAYEILGVASDATMEEVRAAFHRSVLRYHPDRRLDDPAAAERQFHQLVEAYRHLRRQLQGDRPGARADAPDDETLDPIDFVWMQRGLGGPQAPGGPAPSALDWCPRVVHQKVTQPATDETAVFVLCWVLAVALAIAAGAAAVWLLPPVRPGGGSSAAVLVLAGLGTYLAVLALALGAIFASRKTAWLFRVVGFIRRRALPKPPEHRLPREP